MAKAVAYLRVSTASQATDEKFGLKEQESLVKGYAETNGYEIIEWYTDGGISGIKEERPAMDAILYGDLQEREVEAVIVAKSDRVARDIKLYYYYLMLLEKSGIKLISATEPVVNDETGLGNIYYALMMFVAEQERKNIQMRTSLAKKKKAMQGGYVGGRVPYGYTVFAHELHKKPDEARCVEYIFALRRNGYSIPKIVTRLAEGGYRTRIGTLFSIGGVDSILKNELFYMGYYNRDGRVIKGRHEPLIPEK